MDQENVDRVEIWHYAVYLGTHFYMEPACLIMREPDLRDLRQHGFTIVRGDVTCTDCKRAMGMPIEDWTFAPTRAQQLRLGIYHNHDGLGVYPNCPGCRTVYPYTTRALLDEQKAVGDRSVW